MTPYKNTFYGKYRGEVVNQNDPQKLGRLQVTVPGVCESAWALPCSPFAGPRVSFSVRPPQQACVWVEFECGDPSKPIVVGYYWNTPVVPPADVAIEIAPTELRLSCGLHALSLSSQGITVESNAVTLRVDQVGIAAQCDGAKLEITADGVEVTAGDTTQASFREGETKLKAKVVDINEGALQVV